MVKCKRYKFLWESEDRLFFLYGYSSLLSFGDPCKTRPPFVVKFSHTSFFVYSSVYIGCLYRIKTIELFQKPKVYFAFDKLFWYEGDNLIFKIAAGLMSVLWFYGADEGNLNVLCRFSQMTIVHTLFEVSIYLDWYITGMHTSKRSDHASCESYK